MHLIEFNNTCIVHVAIDCISLILMKGTLIHVQNLLYFTAEIFTSRNFTLLRYFLLHEKYFSTKIASTKSPFSILKTYIFYLYANLCARVSIKHKKTFLRDTTIILLKIEIPCDKYFLCSKVFFVVKFTTEHYSKL